MTKPFPSCIEIKETLDGNRYSYTCELIRFSPKQAILRYIVSKAVKVETLILTAGTVTYAFYWPDKPFTLYKWYDPQGRKIADYFNIADTIEISQQEIRWRDLVIDVLRFPDGSLRILDEAELPQNLDQVLYRKIMSSKKGLLSKLEGEIEITDREISGFLSEQNR